MVMVADGVRMGRDVSWVLFNSSTEDISMIDTRGVTVQVLKCWHNNNNNKVDLGCCRLASRVCFSSDILQQSSQRLWG